MGHTTIRMRETVYAHVDDEHFKKTLPSTEEQVGKATALVALLVIFNTCRYDSDLSTGSGPHKKAAREG
jgi:hypothetical protein